MEMNRDIAKISRIRGSNTYQQKWGTGRGDYQNKERAGRFQQGFQPAPVWISGCHLETML